MKNKRFLAFLLVISFFIQLCPIEIAAEGSKNMVESGMGDRPYIEWFNNRTAGLLRMQKVYVYAKAGETIFFGSSTAQNLSRSSVVSSLNNSFGYILGNSSRARNAKFAVTLPYSQDEGENEEVTYRFHRGTNDIDGIQDSNYGNSDIFLFTYSITTGMIRNVTQESNGPNITGISLASMALAENVQTAENSIGQADSNEIAGETVIESTTAADSTQSGNSGGGGSKDNTTSSSAIDVPESVNPSYGDETDVVEDKTEITTAEDNSQENTPVQGETADSSISGAAIYTDSSINNFADYNAFMEDNCDENTEILQPDVDAAPVSDEVASASAAVYAMSDGYTPYYFKAPLTGVYTFRFFGGDYTSGDNPPPVSVNNNWSGTDSNRNNYIAAWDITVYKNTGVKASGRVFVDRLFLNMGNNSRSLYAKNYVLTDDGFEYMIDFNGIDPWGFLFYANNRGMLLKTINEETGDTIYQSLYHSIVTQTSGSQMQPPNDKIELNITPTKSIDKMYYIFFEEPDADLLLWYTGKNRLTTESDVVVDENLFTDFTFTGKGIGGNWQTDTTTVGFGGYFTFDYQMPPEDGNVHPTAYEVVLDFTDDPALQKEYGYPPGMSNKIVLSNVLLDGKNGVYWDGKDEYGHIVPHGSYNVAHFVAKSGEVHFPLLDAENNAKGIRVKLMNSVSSSVDPWMVHYNNTNNTDTMELYGQNGTEPAVIADAQACLSGVSSENGAMPYDSSRGNNAALDIWASFKTSTKRLDEKVVKVLPPEETVFKGDTWWQYYAQDGSSGNIIYDATGYVPKGVNVKLQRRLVLADSNPPNTEKDGADWQTGNGTDSVWEDYKGKATTTVKVIDSNGNVTEKQRVLNIDPDYDGFYNAAEDNTSGEVNCRGVYIPNYSFTKIQDETTGLYMYAEGEGSCIFSKLPRTYTDGENTYYYQYRIVDTKVRSTYIHSQQFGNEEIYALPGENSDECSVFEQETLKYNFKAQHEEFELALQQLWDDGSMPDDWVRQNRPKAVKVALLYGIVTDKVTDVDFLSKTVEVTKERDLNGNEVNVAWCVVQQSDEFILYEDTNYADSCTVWKYDSYDEPYFYRIRPVSYSMDGTTFVSVTYHDAEKIDPVLKTPVGYYLKDYTAIQYDENGENKVTVTDAPGSGKITVNKLDENNRLITSSSAFFNVCDENGTELNFRYNSVTGEYDYCKAAANDTVTRLKTVNGKVVLNNIPLMNYTVTEKAPPIGYIINDEPISISVRDFYKATPITDGNGTMVYQLNYDYINRAVFEITDLPQTGGRGRLPIGYMGVLALILAVVGFVHIKNKNHYKGGINMKEKNSFAVRFSSLVMAMVMTVAMVCAQLTVVSAALPEGAPRDFTIQSAITDDWVLKDGSTSIYRNNDRVLNVVVNKPESLKDKAITFTAYQFMSVSAKDSTGNTFSYSVNPVYREYFKDYFNLTECDDAVVLGKIRELDMEQRKQFVADLYNYSTTTAGVFPVDEKECAAGTISVILDCARNYNSESQNYYAGPGYYIIGNNANLNGTPTLTPITEDNFSITLKGNPLTISKNSGDVTTVNIGDKIPYTVETQVPNTAGFTNYKLTVTDIMDKGLTYNDDLTITVGSDNKILVKDRDYTAAHSIDSVSGKTTLVIEFLLNDENSLFYNNGLVGTSMDTNNFVSSAIKINYTATVNNDATLGNGTNNENAVKNTVKMEYGEGMPEEIETETSVYTFGIRILKTSGIDENAKKLADAHFTLQRRGSTDNVKFKKIGDIYYHVDANDTTTPDTVTALVTDANGIININGLKAGEYVLTETKAPTGYHTIGDQVITIISDYDGDPASYTLTANTNVSDFTEVSVNASAGIVNLEIIDPVTSGVLPSTGGAGRFIIYGTGILLMIFAGCGFAVLQLKKKDAQE